MWTHFNDMNSGGGRKEAFVHCYIEASRDEAVAIFFSRFGHNPERVSCTCCGPDYSITTDESLAQITGFHRGCRSLETPRDPVTGLYRHDDPVINAGYYLEADEEPPEGYSISNFGGYGDYRTVEDYLRDPEILFIRAETIQPHERTATVPAQGYVWKD